MADRMVTNEEIAEAVRALIKAPESVPVKIQNPDHPAEPGKWLAYGVDITATGTWYIDGETDGRPNIEIHLEVMTEFAEVEDPSDDAVVNMQDRMEDLDRQWDGIKRFIRLSLENGDPSFAMEARDLVPGLFANAGALLAAINAAIKSAE